jgi:glycosyltransferase involved in cell wall biosynthesis
VISILILTYQEEQNLPRCLEGVSWCDDVVVIDSFSTDRTVEIARSYGARVLQRAFDTFAGQRNYGLEFGALRHEWVLHLDADEVVTSRLRDEMIRTVAAPTYDAYELPSKMMFGDVWLKRAGMYPTYQVRLGRRDALRFQQVGHGQRETLERARVGRLREGLNHFSFSKGLAEWVEKHNRYSTAEAERELAVAMGAGGKWRLRDLTASTSRWRALKQIASDLPFRPALRFLYMYVWRLGFLDGRAGYTYCRLLALYEYLIVLKKRELGKKPRSPGPISLS